MVALEGWLLVHSLSARRGGPVGLFRTVLVLVLRTCALYVLPQTVDLLAVWQGAAPPNPAAAAAAGGGGAVAVVGSMLAFVGAHARAAVLLAAPVAWLHGSIGASAGWPLPPLLHLAHHTVATAFVLRRAPRGGSRSGLGAGRGRAASGWPRSHACVHPPPPPLGAVTCLPNLKAAHPSAVPLAPRSLPPVRGSPPRQRTHRVCGLLAAAAGGVHALVRAALRWQRELGLRGGKGARLRESCAPPCEVGVLPVLNCQPGAPGLQPGHAPAPGGGGRAAERLRAVHSGGVGAAGAPLRCAWRGVRAAKAGGV